MIPLILALDLPNEALTIGAVGGLAWLITQHFLFRKYIREAAGVKDTHQVDITGQPITVQDKKRFVERSSYETSAKINRDEHQRIEKEFTAQLEKLQASHHALAREVSEITAATEINGNTLRDIGRKLDSIKTAVAA